MQSINQTQQRERFDNRTIDSISMPTKYFAHAFRSHLNVIFYWFSADGSCVTGVGLADDNGITTRTYSTPPADVCFTVNSVVTPNM